MGQIVFSETIVLIFYMMVGWFLNKKGAYKPSVSVFIGMLLTHVALPAAIIHSFQVERTPEIVQLMKTTFVYSLIMLLVTLGVGYGLATIFRKKGVLKRLWVNCLTFSNILFIGIPIVGRLYGQEGLIVLVVYNTVTSLFLFTIGIMIFSNTKEARIRQMFTTPTVVAAFVGIALFALGIKLPQPVASFNEVMSGMTAPLAMIINGALFSQNSIASLVTDKDNLQFTLARVILVPLMFIWVLRLWVHDPIILGVLTMVTGMPTGSLNALLAEEYGGEGNKVSQYIALSTVVSMVTLPLVMTL